MPTNPRFAATIGFFDGVHRGHQHLVGMLKAEASRRCLQPMVVTFAQHPRQVLCPDWQPQLITTPEEKHALLRQTGVSRVEVLPFSAAMSQLPARQFMQQVLRDQLGVQLLLTGYDNHFGHRTPDTSEGFADYAAYGREMGIDVVAGQPLTADGTLCYSSSLVRRLLAEGKVAEAATCLGRPYNLSGRVVHGQQIGRRLGFPTANIVPLCTDKMVPREGVYAVQVELETADAPLPGMMNIGRRPTFDGRQPTLEVNIFGFSGDLYGQTVNILFIERLRSEQHFDSPELLTRQMHDDAHRATLILKQT